jgi:hypothetical protein
MHAYATRGAPAPRSPRRSGAGTVTPTATGRPDARAIAAPTLLAAPLQCLRSPRRRRACAVRDPMGCKSVVGRIAPARAVFGVRTQGRDVAAPELGRWGNGVAGVSCQLGATTPCHCPLRQCTNTPDAGVRSDAQ